MSTISNVQEAREALCNGELFQVGGRFINPRDIVEVDPNGGTNPIFRLEDGRTVQHNRFTPGDVGDYLAAALDYAQRGGAQSEAIKPKLNRIMVGAEENKIIDTNGAGKASLAATPWIPHAFLPESGIVLEANENTFNHQLENYKEGTTTSVNSGSTAVGDVTARPNFFAEASKEEGVFWVCAEDTTNNNGHLFKYNLDGSVNLVKQNFASGSGDIVVGENHVYVLTTNDFHKIPKDGGSVTTFGRTSSSNLRNMMGDEEAGKFFHAGLDQLIVVDSTGSEKYRLTLPRLRNQGEYLPKEQEVWYIPASGLIKVYDATDGTEKRSINFNASQQGNLALGLDLSVV